MSVSFRRWALWLPIILLVEICGVAAAAAQTAAAQASETQTAGAPATLIRGTVRAPSRADDTIAAWYGGHPVTLQRVDTGQQWHTTTSSMLGSFEFQGLPAGRYR